MNKTRFLTGAVVVLALLNIMALVALCSKPAHPAHNPEGPRKTIIARLRFDKQQIADYDILVEKHRADISQKDSAMTAVRKAIYHQLQSGDFSKKDSLIVQVGRLQSEIELIHLSHFQDIKNLCRAEQLEDFNKLAEDLFRLFGKQKRPKKQ